MTSPQFRYNPLTGRLDISDISNNGGGTVTSFSFQNGNGFIGTVANALTTPRLELETSVGNFQLIYANAGDLVGLPVGTSGQSLISHGVGFPASFEALGTLSGLTAHGVLLAQGASAFTATAPGTTGQVLTGVTGADPIWAAPATSGTVTSVNGVANRISIGGTATDPIVDIAATYVGQTSITTLGTILTGVWNGTKIAEGFGGTNQTTYAVGDILYASAINTLSKLTAGSNTQVLTLSAGIPSWASPAFTSIPTITGNSGSATFIASNLNLTNLNTNIGFVGSSDDLVQDFGLTTNLILGSNASGITSGTNNVAVGQGNINGVTSGNNNTAIGFNALKSVTTALLNTAVGAYSQQALISGATANTSMGYASLFNNTGDGNTAIGYSAMTSCTTGSTNCAIGSGALGSLTTGTNNIGIGPSGFSGGSLTGSNSSNIAIGNPGTSGDNHVTRIGVHGTGTGQQSDCYIAGAYNSAIGATNLPLMVDSVGKFGTNNAGNSGIGYISGTLTNAQIKLLHATPITIIPAQGAGTFIRIISWTGKFNYGGNNAFTAGAGQTIAFYLSTSNTLSASLISNATLTGTTSTYALGNALPSTFTTAGENQPLILYNSNVTEISGNAANDNTITYNICYQIIKI